ncbi:hypothetical protein B0H13DRAFT_1154237 [Mycena leptocephala]|nr:hypothetical protein B0H13DRAFT_1154237 [Mycena leptocephala]
MSLQELPLDVLLELVKLLCVGDLISFLSTCRVTRKLEFQRTLWLDALVRIQEVEMQPVALPNGQALDSLSLSELQNTVRQANRLMNNFKSDNPRPVRIRSLEPKFVPSPSRIFCIPGTNLAVSHFLGSVSCWDILASKRVACLELPELEVRTEACMEIKGKALIGASLGRNAGNLVAIWIDYHDRANISISHVISPDVTSFSQTRFFINSQVFGIFQMPSIISWSMDADTPYDNNQMNFTIGFTLVRSPIACYLEEGYTYFTLQGLRQPKAVLSPLSTTMKPAPGIMLV